MRLRLFLLGICLNLLLWPLQGLAELRFLLPPVSSPSVMFAAFEPLATHLQKSLGEPIQLSFSADLHQFYLKAREKRAQIVLLCPIAYLKIAHSKPYIPLAGLVPPPGGNESVIVVRSDSPIHTVLQLRGKSFILGNPACAASALVPLSLLDAAGIKRQDLSELGQGGSDSNALMDVAARFYDATAVAENIAEPYLRAGTLRVIARSTVGPGDLIAASESVPAAQQAAIRQTLLNLSQQDPSAMAAIHALATRFTSVTPGTYGPLRSLYSDLYGEELTPRLQRPRWRLGIPPAFSPLTAARLFQPLRLALEKATGKAIEISLPRDERQYLQQVRAGRYQFALLSPLMTKAAQGDVRRLATLIPNAGSSGLALVRIAGVQTASAQLRIAYGSPYCSAKDLIADKVAGFAAGKPVSWWPVDSERAVFTALGSGQANLGVVRSATVDSLAAAMPHTWEIVARTGPAPAWDLVASPAISRDQNAQVRDILATLPKQALTAAGFQEIAAQP
ncbi:phosphate/phosphite/phosphonate ABC transporter substrate-binding protein [Acidithiobacillus sp. CV18-2]|uniref:Phosphate/phosphite/phosphonate ABC transporter substrate-binding protein n=1 Tax=Igneacidithiobacillus copahuensis TaxID=2724909 RepID=A0AAE2YQG0_9PROT|nr:PhnD/SsuA/transferrin family substrate-binding protein [Igneacidithiobacillus copahuensis]MBU2754691.1 phosphate/phosphite/phosphonate ABC transporter substrate-binding protein [Acidithiobacillus sp. CV18-3]MBU2756829.1 phosphate/phosphite/phosphonate ABC transporter substrate-binding protein [Acidithiobacillus sp. BN09-2]MBU2778495.1 phosphate/phosphite/phosphonate ABC transporter substrate-binding protein [Acidithiobacillus sp. CV18-2]MBU2795301.1 phosphate/phosphite/phosphonate ABC transp